MKTVNLSDAKSSLGRILSEIKKGEKYTICERNTPVAILEKIQSDKFKKLKPGLLKGTFKIPKDFDKPLLEFEKDFYGD